MESYQVNLTGFGIGDEHLASLNVSGLQVIREGEIWNKRTGNRYEENIIILSDVTTYEEGFGPAIERIIEKTQSDFSLRAAFLHCKHVELQIWIRLDNDLRVPSINLTPEQMMYLVNVRAHLDIDIN